MGCQPAAKLTVVPAPPVEPLHLTAIVFSAARKLTVSDDPMLASGDRIDGAELIEWIRSSARLRLAPPTRFRNKTGKVSMTR